MNTKRGLLAAAASGGLARACAVLGSMLAIPIIITDVGAPLFGVYALVTGLAALLPFADFGVGLSLVTRLAEARALGHTRLAASIVSSALIVATLGGSVLLIFGLLAYTLGVLPHALGLPDDLAHVGADAAIVAVTAVSLTFPAIIGQRILFAVGRQKTANLWQVASPVLALAGATLVHESNGGVVSYVAATQMAPVIVNLAMTAYVFFRACPELRFRRIEVDPQQLRSLISLGSVFALQGAAMAAGYQTDLLIIAHFQPIDNVAIYGVALKFATIISIVATIALTPLWPVFTEAIARADFEWVQKTLRATLIGAAVWSVIGGAALIYFGPGMASWLTSGEVAVPRSLLAALAIWCGVQAVQIPIAILLNAAGVKTFQAVTSILMAILNLPLSIYFTLQFGLSGPAIGSGISVLTCLFLPYLIYAIRLVSEGRNGLLHRATGATV